MLSVLQSVEKQMLQAAITGEGAFGKLFGTASTNGSVGGLMGVLASGFSKPSGFANGGIMTSSGPLPLRRYEGGGVANSPQLALFGEGKRPEAYVPLPDGRSIPVSIEAPITPALGASTQTIVNSPINVTVNGSAGTPQQNDDLAKKICQQMKDQVRAIVGQELRTQTRPGGMLTSR